MDKDLEKILVEGCIKKDPFYQKQLMEHFARKLMTTCRRYFTDIDSCKDVLQDVFVKVFAHIQKQDSSKGNLEAWVHKICVNECLQKIRRRKMTIVDIAEIYNVHEEPIVFDKLNIEEIIKTIQLLPVQYRTIFNLVAIDGYSHKQVATLLHISPSTSRSNFSRARKRLQELLAKNEIVHYGKL